jgi:hypothetical protein
VDRTALRVSQAADLGVRLERVRGIEPPLRAWESRGRGVGPWCPVPLQAADQGFCEIGCQPVPARDGACRVAYAQGTHRRSRVLGLSFGLPWRAANVYAWADQIK